MLAVLAPVLLGGTCQPGPPPDPARLGLVVAGQSNAVVQGATFTSSSLGARAWSGYGWGPAVDPLHGIGGGSPYPALGDALAGEVDYVPAAVPGSGLVDPPQWQGVFWSNALSMVEASRLEVDAVLWVQGETDAAQGVGYGPYRAALEELVGAACLAWGAPVVVAVIPDVWPNTETTRDEIQQAAIDVATTHPCACSGPDLRGYELPDGVHVSLDEDVADLAVRWREALASCGVL